jgi:Thioredoxin-like
MRVAHTIFSIMYYYYYYYSWTGPPCQRFTSLLSVLHQEANEDAGTCIPFEVVHVSSDDNASMCHTYMNKKHGDWLRIPFDAPLRQVVKQKYGVFAGREQQSDFPTTTRRSGIPTLVVIGRDGTEKALLDCDDPKVIKEMEAKGASYLAQWKAYKW